MSSGAATRETLRIGAPWGSAEPRFATDGSVLEGPATDPLAAQPEEDER